ncbi:uncharacterized protein CTRU02_207382 [Colletotrichum truncatum]|uniref:Uncharacterized protein n=1 Tax=Colletotrichum truncatum TaxID=5467 RepID=A0ACC3Z0P7_COLTU|nr:uncharacterized protein CTRU02_00985 [Colletotrichum truncatum]KAF6800579.1 hypothetical protein CTRU02_00985 [Colletotrichum truncatum]
MAYNHHPSDSISNAAYPSDSSYTPGHHPSSSISNAAYPQDSSYRPSAPTSHPDDKLAMPEARYSQSYNTGPAMGGSRQAPTAPYPQYPPAAQSPSWGQPSPTHDPLLGPYSPGRGSVTPWSPDGMSAANPNLPPPPPYDPSRPGTGAATGASTPRDPVSPNQSESALTGQHGARDARPGSNYAGTPQQTPAPAAAHIADIPAHNNGERPRTYLQSMTGGMPAYGNSPGGLGPVAKARRKRKQKLGILAAILCAVLLFLIALIVGVLVGVVKVNVKDKEDKPPPHGPPRF